MAFSSMQSLLNDSILQMYMTTSTNHMKIDDIALYCKQENAMLTSINSKAETDFLYGTYINRRKACKGGIITVSHL